MDFAKMAEMMQGMGGGGGVGGGGAMPGFPDLANMSPDQLRAMQQAAQQQKFFFYGMPQSRTAPDFKDDKEATWICLYPIYMDPKRTKAGGRRMPKHECMEDVYANELAEICWTMCKIPCVVEPNISHPQDSTARNGRVRVKIKSNGNFTNPMFHNKTSILRKCAEVLPILESRKQRIEFMKKQAAQLREQNIKLLAGSASESEKSSGSSSSSGSNKKKGKKKR